MEHDLSESGGSSFTGYPHAFPVCYLSLFFLHRLSSHVPGMLPLAVLPAQVILTRSRYVTSRCSFFTGYPHTFPVCYLSLFFLHRWLSCPGVWPCLFFQHGLHAR